MAFSIDGASSGRFLRDRPMSSRDPESTPYGLASLATGRRECLFDEDWRSMAAASDRIFDGARVLVIGGAGSIGMAVAKLLAAQPLAALHVVDLSENNLVELVRDLRASLQPIRAKDLRAIPIDFGSGAMRRLLRESAPYDFVFNLAAIKHVRSEKDVYSILHMLDTNVVKQARFLGWLRSTGAREQVYFSVSTDKAADPVNLMGASKRLMEHVLLSPALAAHGRLRISTARFANVAFSDGSLLAGWWHRIAKRQPIPVPVQTRRYFISDAEAAQICVIAALLERPNLIVIPTLEENDESVLLEDVAVRFIEAHGYVPKRYEDQAEAVSSLADDVRAGRYPLLLTPLDTEGEKHIEQFAAPDEQIEALGLPHLLGVRYGSAPDAECLRNIVARIERLLDDSEVRVTKEDLVELVGSAVPELRHSATGKLLDQRL